MKFLHAAEDCIFGIIVGVVLIGLSGIYFALPDLGMAWAAVFLISFLFTLFDMRHTFSDMSGHRLMLAALIINNIIDFVIEISMAAKLLNFNIPYLSDALNPYLVDPTVLLYLGIFFIASSIFWLVDELKG